MEDVDLISAAYRRRSFARLGRVFLVAGLASGFALSSAMAQEAPAGAAKNDISGWVKICKKGEESGGKEVCLVKYEELDPRSGSVLLTAAVRTIEHEDGPKLIIQVPTSYALVIPAGVPHGWTDITDHVDYLSVRPDPDRLLAPYVNPALKK